MDINELIAKINAFFDKLPFKKLAESKITAETKTKFPLLDKMIPFANQIVCGLAVVLVVTVIAIAASGGDSAGKSGGDSDSKRGGASSSGSSAKEIPISDLKYVLTKDGKGVRITSYEGGSGYGNLIIPSTIEGYPVVEIGYYEVGDWDNFGISVFVGFESLVIPESVKVIGDLAFANCSAASIVIPNSVTLIGYGAFGGMRNLTSVVLPDGLKVLPESLFQECEKLSKVTLPASLEEIQHSAFFLCGELNELIIPDSIQKVRFSSTFAANDPDNFAFVGCQKLPLATRARIQGWGYKGDF